MSYGDYDGFVWERSRFQKKIKDLQFYFEDHQFYKQNQTNLENFTHLTKISTLFPSSLNFLKPKNAF